MKSSSNSIARGRPLHARGFTLIELMVVVAVIAILAAIAVPNYQDSVRKARRGQAKADLVELAQLLERRHTVNNSYAGALPYTVSPKDPGSTTHYNITPASLAAGAQSFVLTATPIGGQASDRCGTLTLSSAGAKGKSGSAPLSECW
ncbi:type IV pilin protein [Stenotrophomonas sp. Marseille-Q4652]|uniref:type IV pilin protein n=1 Tax=Stenotrophomonas sp. Marseille-Q4652 TaxID=2866595 RepID=UPI0031BB61FA